MIDELTKEELEELRELLKELENATKRGLQIAQRIETITQNVEKRQESKGLGKKCCGCGEIYGTPENPAHSLSSCGWTDYSWVK